MSLELVRQVLLGLFAAGYLVFLDVPLLTLGQRYRLQLSRERTALLAIEVLLLGLWATFKFYLKWDRKLAPASFDPLLVPIGAVIAAAGVALAVWAKLRLGRWFSASFAIKEEHVLVTDGPYRVTRHPIYTGALAAMAGSALAWNSLLNLALASLFSMALLFHTVFEERLLELHFGEAYRRYRRRVPRLIPLAARGGHS